MKKKNVKSCFPRFCSEKFLTKKKHFCENFWSLEKAETISTIVFSFRLNFSERLAQELDCHACSTKATVATTTATKTLTITTMTTTTMAITSQRQQQQRRWRQRHSDNNNNDDGDTVNNDDDDDGSLRTELPSQTAAETLHRISANEVSQMELATACHCWQRSGV